ncbi:MAG: glycosyltransferase family 39 protein [Flavobacteriales bacterium]|nr:glycosyltransferase family 39 protein [Flavobacteriales bacterium]
MKSRLSILAVIATSAVLLWTRIQYSELRGWPAIKVTTWDAFGYYQYLPAIFIHDDIARQEWVTGIDSAYHVIGEGGLYQLMDLENGNRATKYLGGTALMELPFFLIGHTIAGLTGHRQDGFSPPYQWAIALAPLFYVIIGLVLLRRALLRWYTDPTVALVIVLITLATNAIQYISVDGAQTHGFLFALYCLLLWATALWHEMPKRRWGLAIGATIGLACVTRPTEAIMLFIPLLWNTHTGESAKAKWALVREHRSHLVLAVAAAFVMVLPQLIYWKIVTGTFVFDVGSKWDFFSPHWRVLFGWEKGWFIYTPITLLFIAGLLFMRGRPWWKSVLVFTMLNIWIVIAWHDWRYGGSYSARALAQSCPVLALPFAALVQRILSARWRWPFVGLCAYLLCVNLWQIRQYNQGVIKYDGMTREEYFRVYLR